MCTPKKPQFYSVKCNITKTQNGVLSPIGATPQSISQMYCWSTLQTSLLYKQPDKQNDKIIGKNVEKSNDSTQHPFM